MASDTLEDHYGALGVSSNATVAEIRSAYRAAVKKHHPDVGGDPEMFRVTQRAWEVLSSDEGRVLYDAELEAAAARKAADASGRGPASSPHAAYGGPSAARPATDDHIAARRRHAQSQRDRLEEALSELVRLDSELAAAYSLWRSDLSEVDRAVLRVHHDKAVDAAATLTAVAERLSDALGVSRDDWPSMPTLDLLFAPADEMGFDVPGRIWFTEPRDLLSGPLWLQPSLGLRVRTAFYAALAVVLSVFLSALAPMLVAASPTTEAVSGLLSDVPLVVFAGTAGLASAFLWPCLVITGAVRRAVKPIPSPVARAAVGASVLGVISSVLWWPSPLVALVWTAAVSSCGAVAALARPVLARWRVRLVTATIGVAVAEWRRRSGRNPRRAHGRDRRRWRRRLD